MCQVEQLAVLRSGIAVSISSGESTTEKLEKNMGEQWPQQLERATQEHGWSEKNLKKKFGSEPWTVATAKSARVELKRLWPQYLALKAWCLNVANPQYLKFLNADRSVPSGTTKEDVMLFMRRIFWLLEEHKKKIALAKRNAKRNATAATSEQAAALAPANGRPKRTKTGNKAANSGAGAKTPAPQQEEGLTGGEQEQPLEAQAQVYQKPPQPVQGQGDGGQEAPIKEGGQQAPPQCSENEDDTIEEECVIIEEPKDDSTAITEMIDKLGFKDRHDIADMTEAMPSDFEGPTQLLAWSVCGPIGDNEMHIGLEASDAPLPSRQALRDAARDAARNASRDAAKDAAQSSKSSSSHSTPKSGVHTTTAPTPTPTPTPMQSTMSDQRERLLAGQARRNEVAASIAKTMERMQRLSELQMLLQVGSEEEKAKAREEMLALLKKPPGDDAPPATPPPTSAHAHI